MRLIDADELLKKKVLVYSCFNDEAEGILVKDIEETLTINPEDLRPKGKWEKVIPTKSAAKWSRKVSCSICHREGYDYHRYCPNCGARMEG